MSITRQAFPGAKGTLPLKRLTHAPRRQAQGLARVVTSNRQGHLHACDDMQICSSWCPLRPKGAGRAARGTAQLQRQPP